MLEASELCEGDRGRDRGIGLLVDIGECGTDMALPDDSFRGLEKVDPALELL